MYRRILSPIDGSAPSDRGMREAMGLAVALGAELRFLHVVDLYHTLATVGGMPPREEVIDPFRRAGAALLERAADLARERGLEAQAVLVDRPEARVAAVILQEAERWPADLIVIGTHGRRGIGHLLLGSDAEALIRAATVPVLVVRGAAETPPRQAG